MLKRAVTSIALPVATALTALACGPAEAPVQERISNVPAQTVTVPVALVELPTATLEPPRVIGSASPVSEQAVTVSQKTATSTPFPVSQPTIVAQNDHGSDDTEPTTAPFPTKVGADQEKYPHVKGRLRGWILQTEQAENAQGQDDNAQSSDQRIGPSQEEIEGNDGFISARIRVDTRVEDAKSTILDWLNEQNISYREQGASIAIQLLPSQLAKLGPLSELDAVFTIEEPSRVFPAVPNRYRPIHF